MVPIYPSPVMAMVGAVFLGVFGLALIVVNLRRLVRDWPRLKPRYSVDLAFIQIYLGLALISTAWVLSRDVDLETLDKALRTKVTYSPP